MEVSPPSPVPAQAKRHARGSDPTVLKEWYEAYMDHEKIDEAVVWPLSQSEVEEVETLEWFETEVLGRMPQIECRDGFCSVCRRMLDNWPPADKDKWNCIPQDSEELHTDITETPWTKPKYVKHRLLGPVVLAPYYKSLVAIDAARRRGCKFCAFVVQNVLFMPVCRAIEKRLKTLGKLSNLSLRVFTGKDEQSLQMSFPGRDWREYFQDNMRMGLNVLVRVTSLEPENFFPLEFPMSQDTSLLLIHHWASECLASHEACNNDNDRALHYPSRLIRLSSIPIHLVDTATWDLRPRYATLSHRWGDSKNVCLTTENMAAFAEAIPENSLSPTYKDAILIARKAGLQYLWIDSLCIIQGDDEKSRNDWETEASKMASVYGRSSLNIAASSPDATSKGCFTQPEFSCDGFRAELTLGCGPKVKYDFFRPRPYNRHVFNTELMQRGWVVQEKFLSPRTVHCGDEGIFWECRTKMASDAFPDGLRRTENIGRFEERSLVCPQQGGKGTSPEMRWTQIRNWYADCRLTVPSDKLVAISGIARKVHEETGDQYCAGLWRKNIETQLCWSSGGRRNRPISYRAPSWSWAAVDRSYVRSWKDTKAISYAHVHSYHVTASPDMFGAVSDGWISLGCCGMLSGRISLGCCCGGCAGRSELWCGLPDVKVTVGLGVDAHEFSFRVDSKWELERLASTSAILLPMQGKDTPANWSGDKSLVVTDKAAIEGLVLREDGSAKGQYSRIGSFSFPSPSQVYDKGKTMVNLLQTHGEQVAEAACAEVLDEKEYGVERFLVYII